MIYFLQSKNDCKNSEILVIVVKKQINGSYLDCGRGTRQSDQGTSCLVADRGTLGVQEVVDTADEAGPL